MARRKTLRRTQRRQRKLARLHRLERKALLRIREDQQRLLQRWRKLELRHALNDYRERELRNSQGPAPGAPRGWDAQILRLLATA